MKLYAVNLMPHRLWARQAHRRRFVREAAWAGVLLLLLLAASWTALYVQRERQQAQIAQYRQHLAQAQAVASQRQRAQTAIQAIERQRQQVESLWQQQLGVLDLWGRVAKALPAGTYLTTLHWTPSGRSVTGVAMTESDALAFQQALGAPLPGWQGFALQELSAQAAERSHQQLGKRFVMRALPNEQKGQR